MEHRGAQGRMHTFRTYWLVRVSGSECRLQIHREWVRRQNDKNMEHPRAQGRVHIYRTHSSVISVALSADGSLSLVAPTTTLSKIWNILDRMEECTLAGHTDYVSISSRECRLQIHREWVKG